MDAERTKVAAIQSALSTTRDEHLAGRRALAVTQDALADEQRRRVREVEDLEAAVRKRDRELRELGDELRLTRGDLERARGEAGDARAALAAQATQQLTAAAQYAALDAQHKALAAQLDALTAGRADLARDADELRRENARLKEEAVAHDALRRRLHNEIQELKGNIRVFCRVRPPLGDEGDVAEMAFPDDPVEGGAMLPAASSSLPTSSSSLPTSSSSNPASFDPLTTSSSTSKPTTSDTDARQLVVRAPGESATGASRPETHQFQFDRVFGPRATQEDVFGEVAQLAQSAVDGYDVCVFAYGQTGSGKSFTMEGGPSASTRGLIPRAVDALFETAAGLRAHGWEFEFEGRFLEIDAQKEKHAIKHDPRTGQTVVTGTTTLPLPSPAAVRGLLARAAARRSVAATLANARSSRSHAVFTVRVVGTRRGGGGGWTAGGGGGSNAGGGGGGGARTNAGGGGEGGGARGDARATDGSTTPPGEPRTAAPSTGTTTETRIGGPIETRTGALHLVDLAGSERLAHSGVGDASERVNGVNVRLRETQAINKSLSALGDVIAALGERGREGGERHVPYRNSKLTYLLQNSLGGNSKTLMIVNVSPLAAHLGETLTSLRFATKVNSTTIGTARRTVK
ncbi:P-loop containing nucleoside triphosphate hydrolase protein [Schizophyllum amplum]|uniref:P-loop containing nucleoside triphosphate hydrolase protein n=1 Tax=Schizophyllum amplum TaxID=97359 RepID=A0A550BWD3_9AGAR|nr:P-loop containing nucleoside triphosphate hydrolase protein [Auriculariopsis ampla]